jgi:signal transduction histidine kinase
MRAVEIRFASIPDVTIQADRDRFEMAIDELIHNAVTYSFANSYVDISAIQDDLNKSIKISVGNFGLGIAEDEKDKIFQPYYRGRACTDPQRFIPGSGIGLTVCKAIIEAHGGKVTVESKTVAASNMRAIGHITVFTLSLPLKLV